MMVWKCPPLHLPNWNNLWKWKQEMNAYELAGTIKRFVNQIKPTNNPLDDSIVQGLPIWFIEQMEQSEVMLRQQAQELATLTDRIAELEKGAEPVAWMDEIGTFVTNNDYKQLPNNLQNGMIPLYTTPQTKPLSDEEMEQFVKRWFNLFPECDLNEQFVTPLYSVMTLIKKIAEGHGVK